MTEPKKPTSRTKAPLGGSARNTEAARRATAFIAAYGRTGNATQSAKEAGYSERSARKQGSRLMTDADICARARAARESFLAGQQDAKERQSKALVNAADDAISTLRAIVNGTSDGKGLVAKVTAAVAILDRAGHKPVEKVEQKVELTTDAAAAREKLKAKLAGG
jgi:phage terminase small subunit